MKRRGFVIIERLKGFLALFDGTGQGAAERVGDAVRREGLVALVHHKLHTSQVMPSARGPPSLPHTHTHTNTQAHDTYDTHDTHDASMQGDCGTRRHDAPAMTRYDTR